MSDTSAKRIAALLRLLADIEAACADGTEGGREARRLADEAEGWARWVEGQSEDQLAASLVMSRLGRKGGAKGGPARASALTPDRRAAIAKAAAEKRWGKK